MNDKNSGAQGQDAITDGRSAASTDPNGSVQFTPGPWMLETLDGRLPAVREFQQPHGEASTYGASVRSVDRKHHVCRLDFGYGKATNPADARLMAAAPDLLKACIDVLAQFDAAYFVRNTDSDGCSDWAIKAAEPLRALGAMKAAIAKAEGR